MNTASGYTWNAADFSVPMDAPANLTATTNAQSVILCEDPNARLVDYYDICREQNTCEHQICMLSDIATNTLGFDPLFGFFDENDNFNEMNNSGRIKIAPKLFDNGNLDGLHLHLKSEEILTQAPQKYPILSQVPKDLELLQSCSISKINLDTGFRMTTTSVLESQFSTFLLISMFPTSV